MPWAKNISFAEKQICETLQQYRRDFLRSFLSILCRTLEEAYWNLTYFDYEGVFESTGCQRPCIYLQYKFIGEKQRTSYISEHFVFSLWSVHSSVDVARETKIYGFEDLVADFGGTLSLFFGVSFMTIWQILISLLPKIYALIFACDRRDI